MSRAGAGRGRVAVFAVLGIALGGLAALLVVAYLAVALGVSTVAVGSLLALVPLAAVLFAIAWVDRWEPEPRWALWFAFLWGAAVSVAIALIVDLGVQLAMSSVAPGVAPDAALQAVVQAPVVEEVAKGLGILLLFAFARAHFDGPVDGLVYAATVAAGFAFTENVLYFGAALAEGGAGELGATFVVRGIFSPFAHVLFTACIGIALGVASRRGASVGVAGWFGLGLAAAIALHALWNGSLAFSSDAVILYVTVQVPIFLGAILLVVWLRRQEMRITRAALTEYAAAGWFHAAEVEMLSTPRGRRAALRWARSVRPVQTVAMRRMIRDATDLAFDRHAVVTGRQRRADESALLARISADRSALSTR
ncbi:PrsW family intramembrane metalloprotease [Agromyces silvae]|uniref:PrsW family intramembrane metalloprotease n=1 Tax=Agromyces silvae TaxID=3388266 RepID=UPI00280A71AE|nr:PrsW family intramembrane metalloprotease [Agromyces protaetiae]